MLRTLYTAAALVGLSASPADELSLRYEAGLTLRTTVSVTQSLELEEATQIINGEERGGRMDEMERTSERNFELMIVDSIEAVDDGAPTQLTRTFESLSGDVSMSMTFGDQSQDSDIVLVSDLEGESVVFTQEGEDWTVKAAEGASVDDAYFPGLVADLTFAELLPDEVPALGDEWEVTPDLMGILTRPGGDVGLHPEDDDDFEPNAPPEVAREGSVEVVYTKQTDRGGTSYAVLDLVIDVQSTIDMTEQVTAQAGEEGPEITAFIREVALEGKGTALWDLANGRLYSIDIEVDVSDTTRREMSAEVGGGEVFEIEASETEAGTATISVLLEIEE